MTQSLFLRSAYHKTIVLLLMSFDKTTSTLINIGRCFFIEELFYMETNVQLAKLHY